MHETVTLSGRVFELALTDRLLLVHLTCVCVLVVARLDKRSLSLHVVWFDNDREAASIRGDESGERRELDNGRNFGHVGQLESTDQAGKSFGAKSQRLPVNVHALFDVTEEGGRRFEKNGSCAHSVSENLGVLDGLGGSFGGVEWSEWFGDGRLSGGFGDGRLSGR